MPPLGTVLIRFIPIIMQIAGLAGAIFGAWYSSAMIIGSGIGSPSGRPDESYYTTAGWIIGLPILVFLAGWLWVVVAFLTAPKRSRKPKPPNAATNKKEQAEQVGAGDAEEAV